jgi:hypothetical protein
VTIGFEITTQCGIVHSVKWYRGASRIFLYSGGPRTTQPHREGYTDRYDRYVEKKSSATVSTGKCVTKQ